MSRPSATKTNPATNWPRSLRRLNGITSSFISAPFAFTHSFPAPTRFLRLPFDQRERHFVRHHAREAAALHQLLALAAAAGDFVLRRADSLLAAARRFDRQQIAIA